MSVPANLLAVDVKPEDYIWSPVETLAKPVPKPVPEPPTPSLPRMKISSVPISYEELRANVMTYHDELVKIPNWQEELAKKNLELKAARKADKQRAREARLSAARQESSVVNFKWRTKLTKFKKTTAAAPVKPNRWCIEYCKRHGTGLLRSWGDSLTRP